MFSKHVRSPKPLKKVEFAQKGLWKIPDQHTSQLPSSMPVCCLHFIFPGRGHATQGNAEADLPGTHQRWRNRQPGVSFP